MRVTVHAALSLDGRIARDRARTSLSTLEGRRSAHRARAEADAVLVGSDTVRIDDPQLTVRHADELPGIPKGIGRAVPDDPGPAAEATRQPLRVVLSSRLDVSPRARLFREPGRTLVLGVEGNPAALEASGAQVVMVAPGPDRRVALGAALDVLRDRGVERLLVEGGSRILTAFFREELVDRVELELAMTILGHGTPLLMGVGDRPLRLEAVTVERLGTSVLVSGDVVRERSAR